jgi:hypothetical protein
VEAFQDEAEDSAAEAFAVEAEASEVAVHPAAGDDEPEAHRAPSVHFLRSGRARLSARRDGGDRKSNPGAGNPACGAMLYGLVAYHDFEGITVDPGEKERLVRDIGDKPAVILSNPGAGNPACGRDPLRGGGRARRGSAPAGAIAARARP